MIVTICDYNKKWHKFNFFMLQLCQVFRFEKNESRKAWKCDFRDIEKIGKAVGTAAMRVFKRIQ